MPRNASISYGGCEVLAAHPELVAEAEDGARRVLSSVTVEEVGADVPPGGGVLAYAGAEKR